MTYRILTYDAGSGFRPHATGLTMRELKREVAKLNRSGYAVDLEEELRDSDGINADPSVVIEEEDTMF